MNSFAFRKFLWRLALLFAMGHIFAAEQPFGLGTKPASAPIADLNSLLLPLRETNRLPALAAAVVRHGDIVAAGGVGVRRSGGSTHVTGQKEPFTFASFAPVA